jgi:hypothetical protein
VAELLPHVRAHGGEEGVRIATRLAEQVDAWARGELGLPSTAPLAYNPLPLTSVADARSLLRTCSYYDCASLEGDSEAGVKLQACAKCGGARYCGRACQVAHWKAGHKEACTASQAAQGARGGGGDTRVD